MERHRRTSALVVFFVGILFRIINATAVLADPSAGGAHTLSSSQGQALADAAREPLLLAWQREFMLQLAEKTRRGIDARESIPGVSISTGPDSTLSGQSAIYDPVRERMIVFGGYWDHNTYEVNNEVWALSLAGAAEWKQLTPGGMAWPIERYGHSAIYDPVRDRMVVFGGFQGFSSLNDVWALSLAGTVEWVQLAPAGTAPSVRGEHSAIYDPVRDRMIIFGGSDGISRFNSAWAMSLGGTPTWSQLSPTGTAPSPRKQTSAIYDPLRDRMLVIDGHDGSASLNEAWALSFGGAVAWNQIVPTGSAPSPRSNAGAIYDSPRDRLILFGGSNGNSASNETWALSLGGSPAWGQVFPSGTPPTPRDGSAAIYDSARARVVVFGNSYDPSIWALELAGTESWARLAQTTWSEVAPPGPIGRMDHSAVYDALRNRMIVFGGRVDAYTRFNDVWTLSLGENAVWTQLLPAGTPPSARYAHDAFYDPVRDRMIVVGGYDGAYRNDTWELSLSGSPAWTQLLPTGTPPSLGFGHGSVYDPARDRFLVFKGSAVSVLSLGASPAWSVLVAQNPGGLPIYDPVGDRVISVEGSDPGHPWSLSLVGPPTWTQLLAVGRLPESRTDESGIYDPVRGRFVMFGGSDPNVGQHPLFLNDLWELSLAPSPAWSEISPSASPYERDGQSTIYDPVRDRMVVFGGEYCFQNLIFEYVCNRYNDVWTLAWGAQIAAVAGLPLQRNLELAPPRPNPFRGSLNLEFSVASATHLSIEIYDVNGRRVARILDQRLTPGRHSYQWNGRSETGSSVPSGVYFVGYSSPQARFVKRVVLMR